MRAKFREGRSLASFRTRHRQQRSLDQAAAGLWLRQGNIGIIICIACMAIGHPALATLRWAEEEKIVAQAIALLAETRADTGGKVKIEEQTFQWGDAHQERKNRRGPGVSWVLLCSYPEIPAQHQRVEVAVAAAYGSITGNFLPQTLLRRSHHGRPVRQPGLLAYAGKPLDAS